jgi:hypothetical protein
MTVSSVGFSPLTSADRDPSRSSKVASPDARRTGISGSAADRRVIKFENSGARYGARHGKYSAAESDSRQLGDERVFQLDRFFAIIERLVPRIWREVNMKKEYVVPAVEDLGSLRDETQGNVLGIIRVDDGGTSSGGGSTFS